MSHLTDLRWSIRRDPAMTGARNMAVDEALATCLGPGQAVLRLYEWARPTVSFGRNESARGRYRPDPAFDFVRRPTGGRAVLHRDELTYAVTFPAVRGLREAYLEIHELLLDALRELGVPAALAAAATPPSPSDPGSCFERPVGGEVVVNSAKLVGSAQARLGSTILQHGSLLRVDDQSALGELAPDAERGSRPTSATTLAAVLGRVPDMPTLRRAVEGAFARRFGSLEEADMEPSFRSALAGLESRYASSEWTWRR